MASFCLLVLCWQVSVGQSQLRHCVLLSGCGGLWWQLLEEMLEVPNVVCRISLLRGPESLCLPARVVGGVPSSLLGIPGVGGPRLRRQLHPPRRVPSCCPRCLPPSGLVGRGEGPERACVHTWRSGRSLQLGPQ